MPKVVLLLKICLNLFVLWFSSFSLANMREFFNVREFFLHVFLVFECLTADLALKLDGETW